MGRSVELRVCRVMHGFAVVCAVKGGGWGDVFVKPVPCVSRGVNRSNNSKATRQK